MAAYSREPRTKEDKKWGFVARSNIQVWKGSPKEIGRAMGEALANLEEMRKDNQLTLDFPDSGSERSFIAYITSDFGKQTKCTSVHKFNHIISQMNWESIDKIRIEIRYSTKKADLSIVARRQIPSIVLESRGSNEVLVQGLAEVVHRRMMEGYVDRLGFWRGIAAFATPLTLIPVIVLFNRILENLTLYLQLTGLIILISLAFPLFVLGIRFFEVKIPVEFVDVREHSREDNLIYGLKRFLENRWIRRVLYITGAILIGVASSKISDAIPFP